MEDEMPKLPPAAPTETEINAAFETSKGSATGKLFNIIFSFKVIFLRIHF